jgi:hypothetical protein
LPSAIAIQGAFDPVVDKSPAPSRQNAHRFKNARPLPLLLALAFVLSLGLVAHADGGPVDAPETGHRAQPETQQRQPSARAELLVDPASGEKTEQYR